MRGFGFLCFTAMALGACSHRVPATQAEIDTTLAFDRLQASYEMLRIMPVAKDKSCDSPKLMQISQLNAEINAEYKRARQMQADPALSAEERDGRAKEADKIGRPAAARERDLARVYADFGCKDKAIEVHTEIAEVFADDIPVRDAAQKAIAELNAGR